jgi:hypothetical protein
MSSMRGGLLVVGAVAAALWAAGGAGAEDAPVPAHAAPAAPAPRAGDGLRPGDVLDQRTWEQAEGLLPPEILAHYRTGGYANPIVSWPADVYTWPTDFAAASKQNGDRFAIGPEGHVVDRARGQQPPFILGFPFPTVDPKDPAAGSKAVWNFLYRTWYFGNLRAQSQLNMVNATGVERRINIEVLFMYYDGVPADEQVPNPQNFLTQSLNVVTQPADVHGTAALTWRYRDPRKRDSAWSYVPALRRVRQVSPANRSDGFLGSDMSQDDGPFFDGKPEDFVWKLTGEVDQLRIVDPLNLEGKSGNEWIADGGGWRAVWPDIPFLGYMDPSWKGLAWAPTGAALARRRFYVVEGVPKDRYYLYGRLELYLDTVSFQGAWNRKFDWKGELLNSMQVMAWNPHRLTRPDGRVDFVQGGNMAFQCAESVKLNRATVAGIKWDPKAVFDGRIKFDPALFDLDTLARHGK